MLSGARPFDEITMLDDHDTAAPASRAADQEHAADQELASRPTEQALTGSH